MIITLKIPKVTQIILKKIIKHTEKKFKAKLKKNVFDSMSYILNRMIIR